MGLNSLSFLIQFTMLFSTLCVLQVFKKSRIGNKVSEIQLAMMLLFSYYFVLLVSCKFALCLALITLITYLCGLIAEKNNRASVVGSILLVIILFYFKYAGFFINEFSTVFGIDSSSIRIILPLGMSFYIFSGISYLMDVYRKKYKSERNITHFALFMAFFPKLTAGPIVRYPDFEPQITKYAGIVPVNLCAGMQIFVMGLFKKNVLADHLGVFVDDVFRTPMAYSTGTVILSAVSYSLQIYLDFSGYSDMAIGLSKILGIDIKKNFNLPYVARGFSDFWNRWHISLSEWLKDYVYIPLGGNRKGSARTYINLVIVMLVSGAWHGAGWTFLIWGLLHGIASCVTRHYYHRDKGVESAGSHRASAILKNISEMSLTFIFVTLFWTVFRSESVGKMLIYWRALFTIHDGIKQPYSWSFASIAIVSISTFIAYLICKKRKSALNGFYPVMDLSKTWSLIVLFTMIGLTVLLGYYGNTAFIYGGF